MSKERKLQIRNFLLQSAVALSLLYHHRQLNEEVLPLAQLFQFLTGGDICPTKSCKQLPNRPNRQGFRLLQVLAFCVGFSAIQAFAVVKKLVAAGLLPVPVASDATTVLAPVHNTATFACSVTPLTLT